MNVMIRTIACACVCVLLAPAVAGAQQTSAPPGITVVGSGTATVGEWVQEVDLKYTPSASSASQYDVCAKAIAGLGDTIHASGLPASALVASATVYVSGAVSFVPTLSPNATPVAVARVHVPPSAVAHFMTAATRTGWKATARLVPSDLAAAKDSAYKAAYADAHARALTIAAADGHHLGRLLNVTPALGDYFGSMMNSVASIFDALGKGNILNGGIPDLTESATFTFEITP
jgi:uncharacterized protein YggE